MTGKRPTRKTVSPNAKSPPQARPKAAKARGSAAPKPSPSRAMATTTNTTTKTTRVQKSTSKTTALGKVAAGKKRTGSRTPSRSSSKGVRLLAGGNPQIAKGEGDTPVQAYIAALTGWKRDLAEQLDQLITQVVPGVQKAVKWNSPFYGVDGGGWFLGVHAYTRYLKLNFFKGSELRPLPPVSSASGEARYVHLSDQEPFDTVQLTDWIRQAAAIPGWKMGQ